MSDYAELKARLSIKADMIQLGEKIEWGSDSAIMREAADAIDALERERDKDGEEILYLRSEIDAAKARMKRLREALQSLVALNDNYSPFGGEIYQDRVNRVWERARAALQEDKSHE